MKGKDFRKARRISALGFAKEGGIGHQCPANHDFGQTARSARVAQGDLFDVPGSDQVAVVAKRHRQRGQNLVENLQTHVSAVEIRF